MIPEQERRTRAFFEPGENDVPLRQALAAFMSEDSTESYKKIDDITDKIYRAYGRYSFEKYIFGLLGLGCFLLSVMFSLICIFWLPLHINLAADITLACLALSLTPFILWHIFEYGWARTNSPVRLLHEADPQIDMFLGFFQQEQSYKGKTPKAYYFSIFNKKRIFLSQRQFFGRLRYLLFSNHLFTRTIVTHPIWGLPAPPSIYVDVSDLDYLIKLNNSRRKSPSPGRPPKYQYVDAVISLIGDKRIERLASKERHLAVQELKNILAQWFEDNAPESGDVPRGDLLQPYAEKIYERLKFFGAK